MLQKVSTTLLVDLSDRQLMNLFSVTASSTLSVRGKAILTELLERAYFYDIRRGEFLTAAQWTLFHQEAPPADYFAYWKQQHA